MRLLTLGSLACAGLAVGLFAEQQAYAWSDLRIWLPDLLAGWLLVGLGVALAALRGPRGASVLLALAGFLWFAANFATTGPSALQRLADHAAFLHRGPLFQLALALPAGRPRTRTAAIGIGAAWAASIVWPLWDYDASAVVLAAGLAAVAWLGWRGAVGRLRRAVAARGLAAVLVVAAGITADAARSLTGAGGGVEATVLLYAVTTGVAAALLFSGARLEAPGSLAERAVELERGGTRLRDALRELLGDPGLELAFTDDTGDTLDDVGNPLALQRDGRAETAVTVAGQTVAAIVHDRATLDDAPTRGAVIAATALAAERARLRAEVAHRIDAVDASRRRLLEAEEVERRRLADQLDRGPGAALASVERRLRDLDPRDEQLGGVLARAVDQITGVRPELDALVRGLGGVRGDQLAPTLRQLAAGVPLDVQLDLAELALPDDVASSLWFVCSESLTNAVKHANATTVRVRLTLLDGSVELSVDDDGRGGAHAAGSGLTGLADRLATLAGTLSVTSPAGGGTRIVARLPLRWSARR